MNLLAGKVYDPTTAVSKATTAALAMTALDTTNLRLAITVPAHGMVRFRLSGTLHGATTMPQILLGVMNGATVLGRIAPMHGATNIAATSLVKVEADFIVTGLTPGAMNVDAAYGVETLVASTGLKYGGPNNTTANDAFGGFVFEAWDPQPQTTTGQLAVDANGRVDVIKVAGTTQTAGDIIARLPTTLVGGRIDASVGAMAANVMTAAAAAADLTTELQSGLATAAALATVQADTDDIQSRLPAALVGGRIDANVGALGGVVQSLTDLKDFADTGYDPTLHAVTDVLNVEHVADPVIADEVLDKTGYALTAAYDPAKTAAQAGDAMTLTVGERASVVDKLLNRNQQGGSDLAPTVSQALASGLLKLEIVGTVLTVKNGDGTTAYTRTLTREAADAIVALI